MSEKLNFLGGSSSNNSIQFSERKRFLDYFRNQDLPVLDTLYERRLYGFINNKGHVIMPVTNTTRFGTDSGVTQGLSYVVEMYNSFRNVYRENTAINLPEVIPDLVPKRSFDDFDSSYETYELLMLERLMPTLREKLENKRVSFLKFIECAEESLFSTSMSEIPMTKSGFALSNYSSAYCTGLYIDVVNGQDGSVDFSKPGFYEDPDFECFVKLANESGFYVDANCPWRLVLNLDSEITKRKILNGRDFEEFDKFYYDVYTINVGYDDYWTLRTFMQKLFIEYHRINDLKIESVPRLPGGQLRWLEFLLVNRFREMSLMLKTSEKSEDMFSSVLKKTIDINKTYGLTSNLGSIGFINNYFGDKLLERLKSDKNFTNAGYTQKLQRDLSGRIESI